MIPLQIKVVQTAYETILNYGVIGAILVLCIFALIYLAKKSQTQWEKQEARHVAEITELRNDISEYIREDRKAMIEVMNRCIVVMERIANK